MASFVRSGGRLVAHEIPPGTGYPSLTPPVRALRRVRGTPTRTFASYRLAHAVPLGGGPPAVISEAQIYRLGHGASTMITHRQFEAVLDLAESGLHPGVPFAAYVEVETDPRTDATGRFQNRVLAGTLGSPAAPVWFKLEPRRAR